MLSELGRGGYATVYKVRHNQWGYIRAVRVLNQTVLDDKSTDYQKFLDECKLLLRLGNGSHPNIVHIYQPRLIGTTAVVEMDYVPGADLTHYLEQQEHFVPAEEVLRMLDEIGSALAYCHEEVFRYCMDREADGLQDDPEDGSRVLLDAPTRHRLIEKYKVIHNDIHSGNVIRKDDGHYVLLDFGLAIEGNTAVGSSRRVNGRPEYKAPEKWSDSQLLTEQSDIYSFGVLLYEMLAGQPPFPFRVNSSNQVDEEYRVMKAHQTEQPPAIEPLRKAAFEKKYPGQTYQKDYPDALEALIMKCLEKNPSDRFFNGRELHDAVKNMNFSVGDPPPPPVTEGKKKSRRGLWVLLLLLLAGLGVGGYFAYDYYHRDIRVVGEDPLMLPPEEGRVEVPVSTNASSYKVTVPDWCQVLTQEKGRLVLSYQANPDFEERSGVLRLRTGKSQCSVILKQAKKKATYLKVTPSSLKIPWQGGEGSITVKSDGTWTAVPDSNCQYEVNGDVLMIKIPENSTSEKREFSITLRADEKSQVVKVSQEAGPHVNVKRISLSKESSLFVNYFKTEIEATLSNCKGNTCRACIFFYQESDGEMIPWIDRSSRYVNSQGQVSASSQSFYVADDTESKIFEIKIPFSQLHYLSGNRYKVEARIYNNTLQRYMDGTKEREFGLN